ncbi:DoxX family protein [Cellulomonas sp. DKR-3]|uniref:DoxX family protein n=1 Tax=Cellulomonas fulva TaxID=2835530 RepID=A0ABS5TW19_9CELL|nr:DoxX family protein [Cellulomonas fulva]MBT0993309.1 DoxX family protein [Cellulomonas fulva]
MTSSSGFRPPGPLGRGARGVALAFLVSGTVHLVRPRVFEPIVPRALPARPVVLWSGVAELACAVGMLTPRTRRPAGLVSAALLVVVFPANVQMAVDSVGAARRRPTRGRLARAGITVARLPLQWPLVRWAAGAGR